ncbi:Hyphal wall protein [Actinidia chinensis var. chinensis]|uniref:Hyphal wall protein n=1 Tax=Actinidia chinensis var. chinensis TaxID=1590841 RepID=A0A2R6QGK3_ACTCC|nr:Hyphal wall protein [Actinidia chinensis var. chinensis]
MELSVRRGPTASSSLLPGFKVVKKEGEEAISQLVLNRIRGRVIPLVKLEDPTLPTSISSLDNEHSDNLARVPPQSMIEVEAVGLSSGKADIMRFRNLKKATPLRLLIPPPCRQVTKDDSAQDHDTSVALGRAVMLPNDIIALTEETSETMISLLVMQHVQLRAFPYGTSNGQPSCGKAWYSRELVKLSPIEKTFVRRVQSWENSKNPLQMDNLHGGELGTRGSSGSSLPRENLRWESSESSLQMENRREGELRAWDLASSLQMDNLRAGELGTHGSSGCSLPLENLRRESSKNPLQMDNLRGEELGTHRSSRSSLLMENLRRESSESSLQIDKLRGRELATHESSGSSLQMDGYVPAIRYSRERPTWVLPRGGLGHPLGIL